MSPSAKNRRAVAVIYPLQIDLRVINNQSALWTKPTDSGTDMNIANIDTLWWIDIQNLGTWGYQS